MLCSGLIRKPITFGRFLEIQAKPICLASRASESDFTRGLDQGTVVLIVVPGCGIYRQEGFEAKFKFEPIFLQNLQLARAIESRKRYKRGKRKPSRGSRKPTRKDLETSKRIHYLWTVCADRKMAKVSRSESSATNKAPVTVFKIHDETFCVGDTILVRGADESKPFVSHSWRKCSRFCSPDCSM